MRCDLRGSVRLRPQSAQDTGPPEGRLGAVHRGHSQRHLAASRSSDHTRRSLKELFRVNYVAKHCARGIDHYQRSATVLPEGWTSSGRLWGKGGEWPVRSDNLELDDTSYFRLRRVVRKWLLSKASFNAAQAFGRKQEMARKDLKYLRKAGSKKRAESEKQQDKKTLSSVFGLSSFVPRDLIDVLLVWAIDHPRAVLIDADTGEVHTSNDASDKAIFDQFGM
jgi:hypothetical protein